MGYVYLITNLVNGKQYVGKTVRTVHDRWIEHINKSNNGLDCPLHKAIRKYGSESFTVEQIAECNDEWLDFAEIAFIAALNAKAPNGYNLTDGGEGTVGLKPWLDRRHSTETRLKMSQSARCRKRRPFSEQAKHNISKAAIGHRHTEETKRKLSENHKRWSLGRAPSTQERQKMSEAKKKWWARRKAAALKGI